MYEDLPPNKRFGNATASSLTGVESSSILFAFIYKKQTAHFVLFHVLNTPEELGKFETKDQSQLRRLFQKLGKDLGSLSLKERSLQTLKGPFESAIINRENLSGPGHVSMDNTRP
jgi:hypothetical protein